ncbi:MAG: hypothetical protein ACYDFT_01355 [Thermoplasmata archaeon]
MILWLYALLLRAAAPFQQEPERSELRAMARELKMLEQLCRAHPPSSSR